MFNHEKRACAWKKAEIGLHRIVEMRFL